MTQMTVQPVQYDQLDAAMAIISEARSAIAALNIDQWQDGYPTRDVIEEDIKAQRLFGAYDEQGLMAVCAIFTTPEPIYQSLQGEWKNKEETYVTVHRMASSDRARGKGAALVLMEKAFSVARQANAVSVRIDTHRGNVRMRRFLDKLMFEECGLVDYSCHTAGDPWRIAYEKCLEETGK